MAPPWIGANGPYLVVETPPLWRVFGRSSRWSSLSSGHSWGTGLISNFGRMTGWGRGDWMTAFPISTALPRLRTSHSGLHGLAIGPRRYHLHSRTSEWLISWACSPSWRTLGLKRRPGTRGSGGNLASRPRRLTAYYVGRSPPPRGLSYYSEMQAGLVWKRRIPLKIRIFEWLLLRQRLMTQVVRQRMFPASPVSCPLYDGGPEDCSHLFFQCPLAQAAWRVAGVARLSVTSEEAFWRSLSGGFFRREADWRRIFGTLWAIWIHRNEVVFRGTTPSGDVIIHTAEGFYFS